MIYSALQQLIGGNIKELFWNYGKWAIHESVINTGLRPLPSPKILLRSEFLELLLTTPYAIRTFCSYATVTEMILCSRKALGTYLLRTKSLLNILVSCVLWMYLKYTILLGNFKHPFSPFCGDGTVFFFLSLYFFFK